LLSEPTTKKAARARGKTWRQEILDICPTLDDEFAAEEWCDCLTDKLADFQRMPRLGKVIYETHPHHR